MNRLFRFVFALLLTAAIPTLAAAYTEVNVGADHSTVGSQEVVPGTFTGVIGSLQVAPGDPNNPYQADLYEITLTGPAWIHVIFDQPNAVTDPELALFDLSGNGLVFNNPSTQPAFVQAPGAGTYLLGVAWSFNIPTDAMGNPIFDLFTLDTQGPQSGVGPLDHWDPSFVSVSNYDQVNYHIGVPEPSSMMLLVSGLGAFGIRFRRRKQ